MNKAEFATPSICINIVVSNPKWEIELNRIKNQYPGIRIGRFTGMRDLEINLARQTNSFSFIEADSHRAIQVAQLVGGQFTHTGRHRFVILGDFECSAISQFFREFGAIATVTTVAEMPRVVTLIERHINSIPPQPMSLEQSILNSLPWHIAKN